jgi:cytoskeletal protein CcmA (bactofilin family)
LPVVFRRDSKVDAFQRQISALRHQLGGEHDIFPSEDADSARIPRSESSFRTDLPDVSAIASQPTFAARELESMSDLSLREPALPSVPVADTQTSVISHTTVWTGNLESNGSLHIHGRVEGSLVARDEIFIADEAEVDATIHAANVTVAGKVRGSIQCAERFEILPHGRVAGDVHSPVIVIHEGALIAGEIAMVSAPGEAKSAMATPRAARSRA